jgi:1-acyl-sn-glycerol-3-phosphate acyltransferase
MDFLSYPRGILASVIFGIWTITLSAVVLVLAFAGTSMAFIDMLIQKLWARPIIWASGGRLELRGAEQIQNRSGKGFLLLFNHSSNLDIPALYGSFPKPFRFGAKIELFKIPFFGRAMRNIGMLPIDRSNRNKVMKVYAEAAKRVQEGESFALAPEGTRQPEPKLGPFKRGPFEFALNAQMDIVPVVIAGTYELLPRNTVWVGLGKWTRKVIVEILPPVSTQNCKPEDLEPLLKKVRGEMQEAHNRLYAEIGF